MPATFESLGLRFLYPDNWELTERSPEEGIDGATLELPNGGFFSIERLDRLGPGRLPEAYGSGPEVFGLDWDDAPGTASDQVPPDLEQQQNDLIDAVENLIGDQYGEVELEEWPEGRIGQADRVVEFSFYYLDLLILSRLTFIRLGQGNFVIQIQSESRGFEENEGVFAAIMHQLQTTHSES